MMQVVGYFILALLNLISADSVLELTDQDFKSRVEEHETILVMFYAPW